MRLNLVFFNFIYKMNQNKTDNLNMFTFKIVIAGNVGVGKSNIIKRYVSDEFDENTLSTIGIDFLIKEEIIDGNKIKVQIWDTAGQEKNLSISKSYYKNSCGAILVYDLSNRQSFENLNYWLTEIRNCCSDKMKIILLGNKNDLLEERKTSVEEAKSWAEKHSFYFMEVSAKLNSNKLINEAINELLKDILNNLDVNEKMINRKSVIQKEDFMKEIIKSKNLNKNDDFDIVEDHLFDGDNFDTGNDKNQTGNKINNNQTINDSKRLELESKEKKKKNCC